MNPQRLKYILLIAPAVVQACAGTHLFPSVMIAQAILESNNGTSLLAAKYNNHFGIKSSKTWSGSIANLLTWEYIKGIKTRVTASFRAYGSLFDGFIDRVKFLQVNPRYTKSGVFKATTPADQAKALFQAGYATDPLYVKKLTGLIEANDLTRYD